MRKRTTAKMMFLLVWNTFSDIILFKYALGGSRGTPRSRCAGATARALRASPGLSHPVTSPSTG